VDVLAEAFYRTPRKPGLEESEREHIERAAAEYARLILAKTSEGADG
jgi:hypothetical protein